VPGAVLTPRLNPTAAEPDFGKVLSGVGVADHKVTPKAFQTSSGWREYSNGVFGEATNFRPSLGGHVLGSVSVGLVSLHARLTAAFDTRPDPAAVPAASIALAVDSDEIALVWGVEPGALLQAASISKPVAALLTLRLVAQDKLSLDVDVNKYLTSWQLPGEDGDLPVTVRHLLCHAGALTVHGVPGYDRGQPLPGLAQILDGLPPANTPPVRRDGVPGQAHQYSGGGYVLLQQLLEDVSGRPFADLAAELVLGPAQMTTATYAQPDPSATATAHLEGQPVAWRVYPELATGGLWCTNDVRGIRLTAQPPRRPSSKASCAIRCTGQTQKAPSVIGRGL
jgi:CubicO group peptidase (beta-lactamase class C family)